MDDMRGAYQVVGEGLGMKGFGKWLRETFTEVFSSRVVMTEL